MDCYKRRREKESYIYNTCTVFQKPVRKRKKGVGIRKLFALTFE